MPFPARNAALPAAAAAICAAALWACAGCAPRSTSPASAAPTLPTAESDGAISPIAPIAGDAPPAVHTAASIGLSALSRIERAAGKRPLIELRIDAADAGGAPARLGGSLRVVVRATGATPESQTFDIPMRTQAEADRRHDAILRQYVLRIEPLWTTEPARGSSLEVSVTLTLQSGTPLETQGGIEW